MAILGRSNILAGNAPFPEGMMLFGQRALTEHDTLFASAVIIPYSTVIVCATSGNYLLLHAMLQSKEFFWEQDGHRKRRGRDILHILSYLLMAQLDRVAR